jgi:hypothetical protein
MSASTIKNTTKVRRTYTFCLRDPKGKVTETRTIVRNSQWSAHTAARSMFSTSDRKPGETLTMNIDGKTIEKFTMHNDGWDFEVLNGATVNAASRSLNKATAAKSGQKVTPSVKKPRTSKVTVTRKPVTAAAF